MIKKTTLLFLIVLLSGCKFGIPGVDEKFGKQNFVSSVSLIELHKIRYGSYPDNLSDLKFLGDWDGIWLSAVDYEKVDDGYDLFLRRGQIGNPIIQLPVEFKQGLGLKKNNIDWVSK